MQIEFLFVIVVLILSIVIHEVSHGYVAQMLGDPTARLQGRLTLNPLKHLDPLGSVIIPALLVMTGSNILFGWAKPVPYNPYNLRNAKWGEALVAGAGPAVNLFIALVFGLLIRFGTMYGFLSPSFTQLAAFIVYINIFLAMLNLIPIPPLDGSKVLKAILPYGAALSYARFEESLLRFGFIATIGVLLIIIYFLIEPLVRFVLFLFSLITGISFL